MARMVPDADVVHTLRVFVTATRPLLAVLQEPVDMLSSGATEAGETGLRERLRSGATSRLAAARSRSSATSTTLQERADWWVKRVGVITTALVSAPSVGGALTEKLPLKDALAAAGQGLVLCGIAMEYGIQEADEQVELLAAVLLHRTVQPGLFAANAREIEDDAAEATDGLRTTSSRPTAKEMAGSLWKLARTLTSITHEITGQRPAAGRKGRFLSALPGVGVVGSFLVEKSSLEDAARAATEWLSARGRSA